MIQQRYFRMVWGAIVGAVFGRMLGQLNIVWAWLIEKELFPYVYPDGRNYFEDAVPYTVRVLRNPNGALRFGVIFGAVLGFLVAYTLTTKHKVCPGCKGENPRIAKVCQFCGSKCVRTESTRICPSCGDKYGNGARFCPICAIELKTSPDLRSDATTVSNNPPVT